jgi:O-antigen/teichoic acid export membrane protein
VTTERHYSLRGSTGILFIAQLIGNAGLFVAVLIVARALGPEGRGVTAFVLVTAQVAAAVASFGLPQASMVLVAQRTQAGALLSNLVAFVAAAAAAVALLTCIALLVAADVRPPSVGPTEIGILGAACVANALFRAGEDFLLGCGRLLARGMVVALWSWLYVVVLLILSLRGMLDVPAVAASWAICQAVAACLLIGASWRAVGITPVDLELLKRSLHFGGRLWPGNLASFLNFRVDQVLMGFIASQVTLGIYAVAVNASEPLLYLSSAVAGALVPVVARSSPNERHPRTLRAFRSLLIPTAASVVAAAVLGPFLVPLVFGPSFAASVGPFLLLLPGTVGYLASRVFSSALLGSSAPGLSALAATTSLLVGIALDVALIPVFGAEGAAAAASAAFIAGGTVAMIAYSRHIGTGVTSH